MSTANKIVDRLLEGDDAVDFLDDFAKQAPLFPGTFKVIARNQTWEVDGSGNVVKEHEDVDRTAKLQALGHRVEVYDVMKFDVRDYIIRKGGRRPTMQGIPISAISYWGPDNTYHQHVSDTYDAPND